MRLADVVAQSAASDRLHVFGRPGVAMTVPSIADAVRNCTVRYALDRAASEQCIGLVYAATGLPELDDQIARPPHERFWIELFASGVDDRGVERAGAGCRLGYLVECQGGGRAGRIVCFAENEDGSVSIMGGQVLFDHRRAHAGPLPRGNAFRMRHPAAPQVERLLDYALLDLHPDCVEAVRRSTAPDGFVGQQAELGWTALPAIVAFCSMLNDGAALDRRPVDRTRLNAARARRGKVPLLDHVEVTLDLGRPVRGGTAAALDAAGRSAPRLHLVRGHQVHRSGKIFWRASHLRGTGVEPLRRTVNVVGRRTHGASSRTFAPAEPRV